MEDTYQGQPVGEGDRNNTGLVTHLSLFSSSLSMSASVPLRGAVGPAAVGMASPPASGASWR